MKRVIILLAAILLLIVPASVSAGERPEYWTIAYVGPDAEHNLEFWCKDRTQCILQDVDPALLALTPTGYVPVSAILSYDEPHPPDFIRFSDLVVGERRCNYNGYYCIEIGADYVYIERTRHAAKPLDAVQVIFRAFQNKVYLPVVHRRMDVIPGWMEWPDFTDLIPGVDQLPLSIID